MQGDTSIMSMVMGSGPVVQGVLIILIILSLWSWTLTIAKTLQFRKAIEESERFRELFWETKNLSKIDEMCDRMSGSPLIQVFSSGYKELRMIAKDREGKKDEALRDAEIGSLELALKRAEFDEGVRLEKGITFLATVASAAPFIGLFGTVWGIMNAFHGLSAMHSTTLQAVAPGISEALVATAIGLAAAIPAAVAYNYFSVAIKHFKESMHRFSEEFVNVAERYIV